MHGCLAIALATMMGPTDYAVPNNNHVHSINCCKSNVAVGNGNVQIIIQELHIHVTKKPTTKKKLSAECESQLQQHLSQVAQWERLVK